MKINKKFLLVFVCIALICFGAGVFLGPKLTKFASDFDLSNSKASDAGADFCQNACSWQTIDCFTAGGSSQGCSRVAQECLTNCYGEFEIEMEVQ